MQSIDAAKSLPETDPHKGLTVYAASKTLAEVEAWKFVSENKVSESSS